MSDFNTAVNSVCDIDCDYVFKREYPATFVDDAKDDAKDDAIVVDRFYAEHKIEIDSTMDEIRNLLKTNPGTLLPNIIFSLNPTPKTRLRAEIIIMAFWYLVDDGVIVFTKGESKYIPVLSN